MQDKPIYHQGADRSLVILFIQGSDSRDYLQRMVSCDVSKVDSQQGRRGTLLDGKGRIQATFDLLEIDTGYLLVTSRQESEILKTRLESLIILEDVEIDIDSHEWIHIHGDGAEDGVRYLGYEPQDRFLATHATEDGLLIRRPRFHSIGFDLLVKTDRRDEIVSRLEDMAGLASDTDREHGRILLGLPKIGAEIGAKTLPPEVGYGDAVAYDKGCYAGQEVLARIRTYGHVNREIRRIVFATSGDAKVAPGDGGRSVATNRGGINRLPKLLR